MTYFRPDGHLDEAAFPALEHGEADSLARLEAAEHLSFCDACIDRYAAYLEGAELLCPEEPLPLPVAREARRRARREEARRALRVGVAACLALGIWFGAFQAVPVLEGRPGQAVSVQDFSRRTGEWAQKISDSIGAFFTEISLKEAISK